MRVLLLFVIILFTNVPFAGARENGKKIIIGSQADNMPYEFQNDKNLPDGFSVDLTRAVMREMKYEYEFRSVPFDQMLDKLDNGEIDLVMDMIYSKERIDKYMFSLPHSHLSYTIVCRNNEKFSGLNDVLDKKIFIKKDFISQDIISKFGYKTPENIHFISDMQAGLKMLSEGVGNYLICGNVDVRNVIETDGLDNLTVYEASLPEQELCFASKNHFLIHQINKALNTLISTGEYDKIYYKWFGGKDTQSIAPYFYWLFFIVMGIALVFVVFSIVLRRKVKSAVAQIKMAKNHISNLNKSVNMVIDRSKIDIYMYDVKEDATYIFKNGDYCPSEEKLKEIENNMHPDDKNIYYSEYDSILNGEKDTIISKVRIFEPEMNKYCDYEYIVTVLEKDKQGKTSRIIYTRRNETNQKEYIRKQNEIIQSLDLALLSAKLVRWEYNMVTKINRFTDHNSQEYVLPYREIIKRIHPEDIKYFRYFIRNLLKSLNRERMCIKIKFPDNDFYNPCEITASVCLDKENNPIAIYGIIRDISEVYNYQQQLNEKIELLEAINNNIPSGLLFFDKNGVLQSMNDFHVKLIGAKDKESAIGTYNYLQDINYINDMRETLMSGKVLHYNLPYDRFPSSVVQYLDKSLPHGNMFEVRSVAIFTQQKELNGYVTLFNDVTDTYAYKEKIEELQDNLSLAMDAGEMSAWKFDVNKKIFYILHGKSIAGGMMTMEQYSSFMHPDDRGVLFDTMQQIISKKKEKATACFRLNTGEGWRWYMCHMTGKREKDSVVEIMGTRKDVTTEIKAKEDINRMNIELAKSHQESQRKEHLLSTILNKLPIPIYIKNKNGETVYVNDISQKIYGNGNHPIPNFLNEEDARKNNIINQQIFETGEEYVANETVKMKDGKIIDTYVKKILITDNDQEQILVVRIDTTEQQKTQIASKILSLSLPFLNAYTWYYDTRDKELNYGEVFNQYEQNIREINSFDKFFLRVFSDDRENYRQKLMELMDKDSGEGVFIYRIDMKNNGVYEWWECRVIVETFEANYQPYKFIYGININIDKQKRDELQLRQNKQSLIKLNQQNSLILNNINSVLIYINSNFEIQWTNSDKVLDRKLKEIFREGEKCYNAFNLSEPCPGCPALIALKTGSECKTEFDRITGEIFNSMAIPVEDENGIEGVVVKLDCITQQKKLITDLQSTKERTERLNIDLNSSNQLMSVIIDEAPSAMFIKDVKDNYRYLFASNEFCQNVVHKSREEVVGHTDYEMFSVKATADKFRNDDIALVESNNYEIVDIGEERFWVDGQEKVYQTKKLIIKLPNNQVLLIGQSADITKLARINEDLVKAKEKAEQSDRLKMAFLANMSHEIRTPLNAIVGFSELLQTTEDVEDRESYMSIVNQNNELLLRLIGDILDLSKIESGMIELKVEQFDLSVVFDDVTTTLRQRCTNPQVELIGKNPYKKCVVSLDKNRVIQIVTNFTTNAIKYTPSGHIIMGYEYVQNGIRIYVEDTGIGIPKEKQHLAFQRFEKLDTFAQGTGLGLAICKAITEAKHGKIGLESEVGKGSTFWVWLPCKPEYELKPEYRDKDILGEHRIIRMQKNILIAESNDNYYEQMKTFLADHNLIRAYDEHQAIELFDKENCDLVLMGAKTSLDGGSAISQMIREKDRNIPIYAISDNVIDSEKIQAYAAGITGIINSSMMETEFETIVTI